MILFFYLIKMEKKLIFYIFLFSVKLEFCSNICIEGENFCSRCNPITKLCEKCEKDIFVLNKEYDYREFVKSLKLVTLAESLGGVESLVCHPASMTHAAIPYEIRQKVGIVDELIRLSVGIENVDDIIDDLKQAIEASK